MEEIAIERLRLLDEEIIRQHMVMDSLQKERRFMEEVLKLLHNKPESEKKH